MKVLEYRDPPISLELAKAHLRVGDAAWDDELISAKLEMAVAIAEDITGRKIREQVVVFDVLCTTDDTILLPLPTPTSEIVGLFCSGLQIAQRKFVLLNSDYDSLLNIDHEYCGKKVRIKCVVGYNQQSLPPAIKAAILLILGTLYDNESDTVVGRSVTELSITAEKLLQPWRITPYGSDV